MKKRRHLGQSLIEFALIIRLVLFLLLGFFDLGRAVFYYSSLSNAVREGTRYAIVNKGIEDEEIKDKIIEYAFALADTPNPLNRDEITIIFLPEGNTKKTNISITATYTFTPVTPGINLIAPSGITLEVQSTMRIPAHAR